MRCVSLIVIVSVLALLAQDCMAQCGFQAHWYNQYWGWGNKYSYVILSSESVDLPLYVNIVGHTSTEYGISLASSNGGWNPYSGGRWKHVLLQRADDGMNYPLQFKVTGSPCGDILFTSPAAFTFCAAPYETPWCPTGVTSPFWW